MREDRIRVIFSKRHLLLNLRAPHTVELGDAIVNLNCLASGTLAHVHSSPWSLSMSACMGFLSLNRWIAPRSTWNQWAAKGILYRCFNAPRILGNKWMRKRSTQFLKSSSSAFLSRISGELMGWWTNSSFCFALRKALFKYFLFVSWIICNNTISPFQMLFHASFLPIYDPLWISRLHSDTDHVALIILQIDIFDFRFSSTGFWSIFWST